MSLPAVRPPADPYDHTDERNHLAVHTPNPRALVEHSKLGAMLLGNQSEFAALAKAAGVPAEHMVLELVTAARKKPDILKCTEDSIMTFMFDVVSMGLRIGREVYPVAVKFNKGKANEELRLEAWPGYQGNRTLAIATGAVRDIFAEIVYEGDPFEFERAGVPRVTKHGDGPHHGDMKFAIAVYATGVFPGGRTRSLLVKKDQVEALRKRNKGDTTKWDSPWVTNTAEMWKAKAIKLFAKDLPQNPRLAHLFRVEARLEQGETEPMAQLPAPAPMAALPAGAEVEPNEEFAPAAAEPEQTSMSLGEASVIVVNMKGGAKRMLSEIRNSGLEALLSWAREKLDQDPESVPMQRIAMGAQLVLGARQTGLAKEPPKKEGN